ncbi:hypothetical protein D9M68_174150 [compost metagenome]
MIVSPQEPALVTKTVEHSLGHMALLAPHVLVSSSKCSGDPLVSPVQPRGSDANGRRAGRCLPSHVFRLGWEKIALTGEFRVVSLGESSHR